MNKAELLLLRQSHLGTCAAKSSAGAIVPHGAAVDTGAGCSGRWATG